ncbi:MAG: hypothetical protein ACK51A_03685 [Sphingobacteriia bacterium]|jgi:hypothetical protein
MLFDKSAIESISRKLSLPFKGTEQDWDLEFADSSRLVFFIGFYLENRKQLSRPEKKVLMSLILASYEDYFKFEYSDRDSIWKIINSIINDENYLFEDHILYWKKIDGFNFKL